MANKIKSRNQVLVHTSDLATFTEVPRQDTPSAERINKRQRRYRRVIWASLFSSPVLLIGFVLVAGRPAAAATAAVAVVQVTSPGRAVAQTAMEQWLASVPSPLPGGRVMLWSGVTPQPVVSTSGADGKLVGPSYTTEIDNFIVQAQDGSTYSASMQVAIDSYGGASVMTPSPSLLPIPQGSSNAAFGNSPWVGLTAGTAPDPVSTAISAWGTAFASGHADALRQAIGDPDNTHAYMPLGGLSGATTIVGAAAVLSARSDSLIVRVSIAPSFVTTSGAGLAAPTTPGGVFGSYTYDVLVQRASTAAPTVVAWGAPGGGPTLVPYQNAEVILIGSTTASAGVLQATASSVVTKTAGSPATTSHAASPTAQLTSTTPTSARPKG